MQLINVFKDDYIAFHYNEIYKKIADAIKLYSVEELTHERIEALSSELAENFSVEPISVDKANVAIDTVDDETASIYGKLNGPSDSSLELFSFTYDFTGNPELFKYRPEKSHFNDAYLYLDEKARTVTLLAYLNQNDIDSSRNKRFEIERIAFLDLQNHIDSINTFNSNLGRTVKTMLTDYKNALEKKQAFIAQLR